MHSAFLHFLQVGTHPALTHFTHGILVLHPGLQQAFFSHEFGCSQESFFIQHVTQHCMGCSYGPFFMQLLILQGSCCSKDSFFSENVILHGLGCSQCPFFMQQVTLQGSGCSEDSSFIDNVILHGLGCSQDVFFIGQVTLQGSGCSKFPIFFLQHLGARGCSQLFRMAEHEMQVGH